MPTALTREAQATTCLEVAQRYREPLLALATKLAGSAEEGMNLFQQTLLNCHDAIQRNGFAGERYEFYLYTSLRNLHRKEGRRSRHEVTYDFQQAEAGSSSRNDEGGAPWAAQVRRQQGATSLSGSLAPTTDAYADLAEQVMREVRENFSFVDRLALRLHVDEFTYQAIAELLGYESKAYVWRRVERLKTRLRHTFAQAWRTLQEPE